MTKRQLRAQKSVMLRTASKVARHLGVSPKRRVLFAAVSAALGVPWNGQKMHGYELAMVYARTISRLSAKPVRVVSVVAPATSDDFLQSYAWRRLRMVVLTKRGARCECCGATPADGVTVINVDHVKPRKLFPALALDESNLQILCAPCNHGKGNWDQTDWRTPSSETIQ